MMKKKKPSAVRLDKSKIAAPDEGHTTVCHVRPTEDTCYTVGDVFVSDHPSNKPSTSFDDEAAADAGRNSNMGPKNSTISPYSSSPIAIVVGPGLATYWVPKHLLRSPKWSTTEAGGTICLPEASVATGHTLVHYLYTGTYQALEATGADLASLSYNKFKQGLLVYILASTYELPDLERLAREQIQILGGFMTLVEVLNTVKKECSNLAQCWFHEYLQERVKEQFDLDYTFFTSEAFFESIGKCALHEFMTSLLLGVFSDKLTHTLQRRQSRCQSKETFGTTLGNVEDEDGQTCHCLSFCDGHGTNMCTSSCEISLDLPTESREEDVDGVVSLETSSLPDFAIPGIAMEQPPPLGIPENFEDQGVVQSEPIQLWEEPYESIRAIEEEQREDTVSLPVSEVLPREEMVPPPQPDPMSSEPNRNEENERRSVTFRDTNQDEENERRSVTFRDTNQDEEKIMMIPEEPIPEPAADQEPCPEPEQEHKPEIWPQEPTPDASSTLCPRRSQHLWKSNRWRSCERCQAMLREIAVQLATENKTALLPE